MKKMIPTIAPKKETPEKQVERLAVDANEAAEMLGISPRLVFQLTKTGVIPHKRIGTRVVYPIDALRRYVNEIEETPLPQHIKPYYLIKMRLDFCNAYCY